MRPPIGKVKAVKATNLKAAQAPHPRPVSPAKPGGVQSENPRLAKVKAAPILKSGLTPEQKAWLKQLGAVVGGSDGGAETPAAGAPVAKGASPATPKDTTATKAKAGGPAKAGAPGKEALVEALGPGDIPGLAEKIAGPLKCTCTIQNNSEQTFVLDPASRNEIDDDSGKTMGIAHGKYEEFPPSVIKGGEQNAKFVAVNKDLDLIIIDLHLAGVEGFVRYFIDDEKKTTLTVHFDNPRVGSNKGGATIEGPNAKNFDAPQSVIGGGNEGAYLYVVDPKGGIKPTPGPGPSPQPGTQPQPGTAPGVKSSCLITVNNNTKQVLNLADQGHDSGDFVTFPSSALQPGASSQFVFTQTPDSKDQDCKGFLSWEVGSPSVAIWRNEWHNPKGEKNTAAAPAEPQSAGFRTLAQVGEGDENVPIVFTISGGGAGPAPQPGPGPAPGPAPAPAPGPTPTPGPAPGPSPDPEPDFNPPPGSRQPTLRRGDKSADGWVEYMQQMLNQRLGANTVNVDGNFGPATERAVRAFQTKFNLQVDGTVGNQTWAALRSGTPEAPSTDGRAPHTFEEKGPQARWDQEQADAVYEPSVDELQIFAFNVGEQPIQDFNATVRITPPDTKSKTVKVKIGPPVAKTKTDQGDPHIVRLTNFKKNFPAKDPSAKMQDYLVEAFFDKELGTDFFKGKVVLR